ILGNIFTDDNKNCLSDAAEPPKAGWPVRLENTATGTALLTTTDDNGNYEFEVDTGVYTVQAIPPNYYWLLCNPGNEAVIDSPETDREVYFAAQRSLECPFLEVDLGAPFLRRCFENSYTLRYCNTGTAAADNAYVVLQTDPYQQLTWAAQPYVQLDAHTFRFDLGKIDQAFCGQFPLKLYVDCDSTTLGQTLCPQAHIYPDSLCIQSANYSGASLAVSGACTPEGVRFHIKNEGTQISTAGLKYRVIVDGALAQESPFQLPATDALTLLFPADGRTWRLHNLVRQQADQVV
ncbi:MAG TPA: SdrD B-like domain-containing protein, partial [Saprospiraceae bacterium]|nr:SdrD B-like domain-containing protein [Saprospiraceae bacterium]